jgi:predicted HTH transcriptional regulator
LLGLPNEFGELIQFDPKVYVVTSREGKHREFKQAFVENDFADYTKTLAAFGNAAGGCIVFGISDKPRKIVGIGNITDEAQWADRLKDEFDPEIVEFMLSTK